MNIKDTSSQIHRLWDTEQEILDVIHNVCVENNLRYSLAYGTLIGAVRHKGFIPWDDDIDLIMPRADYEKLLKTWNQCAPDGYILQNTRTDSDFSQNFTKIRKDHTTFLQTESERMVNYHTGIFVDIFPGDRVAPGIIGRKIQYFACALNLLYSRNHCSDNDGIIGTLEGLLLKLPKRLTSKLLILSEHIIRFWNNDDSLMLFFPSTLEFSKKYQSSTLFENLKQIEFNGKYYSCISDPDSVLKSDYGDYMELPPKEKQVWKHFPIILDFEFNYDELNKG